MFLVMYLNLWINFHLIYGCPHTDIASLAGNHKHLLTADEGAHYDQVVEINLDEVPILRGWDEKFVGWLRSSCATAMKLGMHLEMLFCINVIIILNTYS